MSNVFDVVVAGLILVGVFISGMLFMRSIICDEAMREQYNDIRREYYSLAGVKNMSDPLPYVPPIQRRSTLPCLYSLERRLRQGRRGTVMWKAGDRMKYGR